MCGSGNRNRGNCGVDGKRLSDCCRHNHAQPHSIKWGNYIERSEVMYSSKEHKEFVQTRIKKLVSVKSIVTMMLSVVFCVLALIGRIDGEQFLTIFTVIISFYFGTQHERKASEIATQKHDTSNTNL